ncbi:MAG: helix-turn-helix domain-containing protein [Chitinophagaceae bacterium]|nr:MAG: helix-turn-helix domain-containing protein [Chitinophagaceae bacterium]
MKRKLKPFALAGTVIIIASVLFIWHSYNARPKDKQFVIGFSQCVDDLWRKTMLDGMNRELAFHPNLSLKYREAGGNSQEQIRQVRELLKENIDLLIISPNETDPLTPIVEEIYTSGIPVIVIDRKISSRFYTAFVGTDNFEIGKLAGEYAATKLEGKVRAIEIFGLTKSSPAMDRHRGFETALRSYPNIEITHTIYGEWMKNTAEKMIEEIVPVNEQVDLVFAHNDMMALGAYEVFRKRSHYPLPKIIGIDGVAGDAGGMQFITDHRLTATMLYLPGGEESIQVAAKILNKEVFNKENYLQTSVVDTNNVRLFQLQAAKVAGQQQQIERQQSKISEVTRLFTNLQTLLYVVITSLALAIILGGVALYSLIENRKITRKLESQNVEILDQKNQIMDMAAKAHEANEARVNFFTNISHEFRTPLTLILGPVEDLMENKKSPSGTNHLSLIHKNASRLLKLVDQLIDFRKIEASKMKIQATQVDLVAFTTEIVESYRLIAAKKDIDLHIVTRERFLNVWIDPGLFDKVIFNVLSNAMKFTGENGSISVHILKSTYENQALIKVEDTGRGMTREEQDRIFDLYYQGNQPYTSSSSGIGLALTKDFLKLHKGNITVTSTPGRGSTFTISLKLGKDHFDKEELAGNNEAVDFEHNPAHLTELKTLVMPDQGLHPVTVSRERSVVVIEDNLDLRHFIRDKLQENYEVFEAADALAAREQVFNNLPDLILCDIQLPDQDGLYLTNLFKNDTRTAHIPIILLSAQTNIDKRIAGMQSKADVYLTKPFNMHYLNETISSLIANRTRLRDHFITEPGTGVRTNAPGKPGKKFISEFSAYVENNLSNTSLNVDEICRHLAISRVQLYRKVKDGLGVNVNDYILNMRLNKARYQLLNDSTSISEIAFNVGFSSASYFSTVFKTRYNLSPKQFRDAEQT